MRPQETTGEAGLLLSVTDVHLLLVQCTSLSLANVASNNLALSALALSVTDGKLLLVQCTCLDLADVTSANVGLATFLMRYR